ncbi:MAG: hypothetical protein ACPGU6_06460 [Tenacibaculum sp.]
MKTRLLSVFSLIIALNSFAQETIPIPDIGLEECLIDLKIDSNGLNGNILVSDAKYVVNLNINDPINNKLLPNVYSKVKDLTGLESFPNLKRLDCFGNEITKIDLSKSTSITFLNCSENKIESLDLSNNTELVYVSCDNNRLNSIIIGNNNNLESLYCSYNKLTSLNTENAPNLESLDTTGNNLSSITVSETQLNNILEGWYKDKNTVYSTANNKTTPTTNNVTETPKVNIKPKETIKTKVTYNEAFKRAIVAAYDKSVLNEVYLSNKKKELLNKHKDLDSLQVLQWIKTYSKLKTQ